MKKALSVMIEEEVLVRFKVGCVLRGEKMREVLEELVKGWIEKTRQEEER